MCLERCSQCNYSYKNKANDKEKDKVAVKKRIFYLIIIQYSVFFLSKTPVVGFLSLFLNEQESKEFQLTKLRSFIALLLFWVCKVGGFFMSLLFTCPKLTVSNK